VSGANWGRQLGGWVMTARTLLVVSAALALTLGVATAAGGGGGSKSVKGSLSGAYTENFVVGLLGGTSTGNVKHLGHATLGQSMTGPSFQPQTFESTGTWTLTAANGDLMTGTSTGTCTRSSDFVSATCMLDLVSTGGTGRFQGAGATFTATTVITRVACEPVRPFCNGVISSELSGQLSG
jgi:hypothetical protein